MAIVGTVLLIAMSTANAKSTTVIPNAGEITTISKVDNGVLSVTNQVIRNRSQVRECVGACFYASRTITKTWICRASSCALDCSAARRSVAAIGRPALRAHRHARRHLGSFTGALRACGDACRVRRTGMSRSLSAHFFLSNAPERMSCSEIASEIAVRAWSVAA
jgi:hypothetical protein